MDISDEADPPDSGLKLTDFSYKLADISADTDPLFSRSSFLEALFCETFRSMLTPFP